MGIFYAVTFVIGISMIGAIIAVKYVNSEDVLIKYEQIRVNLSRRRRMTGYILPTEPIYVSLAICLFGAIGWMFDLVLDVPAVFSLPSAVIGSLAVSSLISYPQRRKMSLNRIGEDDLFGLEGIVIEDIEADGYGRIEVDYGGINHVVNAVGTDEKQIPKGEKVQILLCVDELYFCTLKEAGIGEAHENAIL